MPTLSFQDNPYLHSRSKRIFDFTVSFILLVVLSPLIIVIAILIKLTSSGPVLFRQKRLGQNKIAFEIIKFRTMYVGAEKDRAKFLTLSSSPFPTFKIANDPRYVGIGKYLSHLGFDEIPQLINVLKGEMSIIGPRPFPVIEADKLPSSWQFRFNAKPGLLSTWAISDRHRATTNTWIRQDKLDIKFASITRDLVIIMKGISQLF